MKKKYFACGLILIEWIIQILGIVNFDACPPFLWSLADALIFLVPVMFGIGLGLACLLPVAVSEFIWFFSFHSVGALLHLASFVIAVIILGAANKKLCQAAESHRIICSVLLFIAVWIGEEALYRALVALFLQHPFAWEDVFESMLSPITILPVMVLVWFIRIDKRAASE